MTPSLRVVHVELNEANAFVEKYHRHHKPCTGHRFSLGVTSGDVLVGVAIVGRPVARKTCQKTTLEVTRLCTDGTPNACSALYSACARAGKALGYSKIQTFILESESGVSLLASGWEYDGDSSGGDWNRPIRGGRRVDQPLCAKKRYAKSLVQ